ncbi:NLR, CARD domain containing 5 [Desmophyllum pertusum]|uniref:NLR, CARD domain containing 5 n=1 Tax=Desmophyllum pertusum TaxID=174260 RepID=A0A9W9YVM4_9CNID|nr:NLR, CARD domain containing 5 [Desmophyllum pertusum]
MEKISLKQLLSLRSEGSIDNEVFQDMLDNPEKVLLVFDGLDEFKHHESCLEDERAQGGNSATEEMPFSALYVKLGKRRATFWSHSSKQLVDPMWYRVLQA